MKKRIVILERHFTYREKGGWFSQKENIKVIYDLTDIKLNARLDELNKAYHKNFYQITADFNLTTKKGRNDFVKYSLYLKSAMLMTKRKSIDHLPSFLKANNLHF